MNDHHSKLTLAASEKEDMKIMIQRSSITAACLASTNLYMMQFFMLDHMSHFFVNYFAPTEPWRKHRYISELVVPWKSTLFTYAGGEANMSFIWRIPLNDGKWLTNSSSVKAELQPRLPSYHTRAMRSKTDEV